MTRIDWLPHYAEHNPDLSEHGPAAELFPERFTLDPRRYPIVAKDPLTPGLDKRAQRAVAACQVLAVRMVPAGPR